MARDHGFDAQPDEQHVDAFQRDDRAAHRGRVVAERIGKHVVAPAVEAARVADRAFEFGEPRTE